VGVEYWPIADRKVPMLTAEIKINGALLQHIYILNTVRQKTVDSHVEFQYTAQLFDVSSGEVTKSTFWHNREDGSLVCIQKALESLKKSS
jgi:hypothetical protein